MDPTDSELLTEVIGSDKAKTTIFYHNESAHINEIINLIRIFGKDYVIDKCHGDNPVIIFKKQKDSVKIKS